MGSNVAGRKKHKMISTEKHWIYLLYTNLTLTNVHKQMDKVVVVYLPSMPMVSSLCFTSSAIILLIDIRLSVMLLLVSTRLSLVTFLRQKHTQSRTDDVWLLFTSLVKQCSLQLFPSAEQSAV